MTEGSNVGSLLLLLLDRPAFSTRVTSLFVLREEKLYSFCVSPFLSHDYRTLDISDTRYVGLFPHQDVLCNIGLVLQCNPTLTLSRVSKFPTA